MVNEILLQKLVEHPCMANESAKCLVKDYASLQLTIQDIYDTKAILRKNYPGLIAAYRHRRETPYKPAYREHVKHSYTPRVLVFDIETAPLTAYVWKRWKENISLDQTISEWFMLAWSAKWLYTTEVMGMALTSEEAIAQDDSRIVKGLWELINEADIVIAFNGLNFDVPRMNTSFLACGLNPPAPYILIDPMTTLKHKFGLSSNKLDSLAMLFGIDTKLGTDFNLWKRCMQGDAEALEYMLTYNKKDVDILEEVYLRLRPWIKSHPNIANIVEHDVCPFCGTEHEGVLIEGARYCTGVNSYEVYRCPDCGAVYRSRKAVHSFNPKTSTIVNH